MKQLFLQQGHTWEASKTVNPDDWLVSEKYDGQRAFWDGGRTRGKRVTDVPYANTTKDKKTNYLATGLWSRYGKVIHASPGFLDNLPKGIALDLEIFGGVGRFQYTTGIVRSHHSPLWFTLTARVFDVVPIENFLRPRHIELPQADFKVHGDSIGEAYVENTTPFHQRLTILKTLRENDQMKVVGYHHAGSAESLMEQVLDEGGEGIIYRHRQDVWRTERVHTLLKRKPTFKGTGRVIGFTDGKGKYEGMVGALIISSGKYGEFQLSGMTDAERKHGAIPEGTRVEFAFDTLTNAGVPRNARLKAII